jgi:hypothetical protein
MSRVKKRIKKTVKKIRKKLAPKTGGDPNAKEAIRQEAVRRGKAAAAGGQKPVRVPTK